jgi:hypothetical protein
VTNFTNSWADGLAFCALADKFTQCKKMNPLDRHQIAFETLKRVGIPQYLDAEDIVLYQDSRSIQTYLFRIYNTFKSSQ